MSKRALEFQISAHYGSRRVLHEVSGTLAAREICALVGLSGSGKSTLALALLRLLIYRGGASTGSIRLAGEELMELPERRMRTVRGRLIGYIPQSPAAALNERVRVRTLLDESWSAHESGGAPSGFFAALLESVQLLNHADFLNQRAGELSAGQGQRLLIALAIMHKPAVLIADEPTSALDAITQAAILRLLGDLNRKHEMAMLFISHDLLSVASLAHRMEILHEGRIVESDTPAEIFRSPQHPFTQQLVASVPKSIG